MQMLRTGCWPLQPKIADDYHERRSNEASQQTNLLIMRVDLLHRKAHGVEIPGG